jgi:hypothetical protein
VSANSPPAPPPEGVSQSGGLNIAAQGDVTVGGDAVAGDKITHITNITNIYQASEAAGTGLNALAALVRSPGVRDQVVAFRADFEVVSRQIDVLADYKELHDLLHQLEFECYEVLAGAAGNFPDDEAETENIVKYHIKLESLVDQMQDTAARGGVAPPDTLWIKRLAALPAELDRAVNTGDRKLLDGVLRRLKQVLDLQPAQINTRLNSTARALRLPALVQALTRVQDGLLEQRDLDPERVREFYQGMEALVTVNQALAALIEEHDGWQAVEILLNRIEDFIEQDLQEIEMSWPDLKAQTGPLCRGRTDRRTLAFVKESENLEAALAAANPDRVRKVFLSYRSRAGELFYRVDLDLKRLCGELRKVGEPLASVLKMIA